MTPVSSIKIGGTASLNTVDEAAAAAFPATVSRLDDESVTAELNDRKLFMDVASVFVGLLTRPATVTAVEEFVEKLSLAGLTSHIVLLFRGIVVDVIDAIDTRRDVMERTVTELVVAAILLVAGLTRSAVSALVSPLISSAGSIPADSDSVIGAGVIDFIADGKPETTADKTVDEAGDTKPSVPAGSLLSAADDKAGDVTYVPLFKSTDVSIVVEDNSKTFTCFILLIMHRGICLYLHVLFSRRQRVAFKSAFSTNNPELLLRNFS